MIPFYVCSSFALLMLSLVFFVSPAFNQLSEFRSVKMALRSMPANLWKCMRENSCTTSNRINGGLVPVNSVIPLTTRKASTLSSILNFWRDEFEHSGVSDPTNSAGLILAHVLGRKTLSGTSENQRMSSAVSTLMTTLAMQRLDGIPLQYVIGEWDFRLVIERCSRDF